MILFVVDVVKFCVLKFAHIAFLIVDVCLQQIEACVAFLHFFIIQKNAFSFVIFELTKFCRQRRCFDIDPIFVCNTSVELFSTLHFLAIV